MVLTWGHAAADVEKTYARSLHLSEIVGDVAARFQALVGLRRFYFHQGKIQMALDLQEQMLVLARSEQNPIYRSRAHMMHGEALYRLGAFGRVREHCRLGLIHYDPGQSQTHLSLFGNDTGFGCRTIASVALSHLGYLDQARAQATEQVNLARELGHPFNLTMVLYFAALACQLSRAAETVLAWSEAIIQIATEQDFTHFLIFGGLLRGWANLELGETGTGIAQIEESLAAWQEVGSSLLLPEYLSSLAEAYSYSGRVERGLTLLEEGLVAAAQNGEYCWQAELYRLKGELRLRQGADPAEAEACFQQAITIAQQQEAKTWELRAGINLAQLWQGQGKREDAHQLLANIYGWFSEGFDTPDLQTARRLLENLSPE